MSDTDTTGPGGTLINFPRIGFNLSPTTTMPDPTVPPQPGHPPTPNPATGPRPRTGRRSPLDALNALPDPGITTPIQPPARPTAGHVPATFRSDSDDDMVGPRLGALSLAAILAVAVAAMRGTHTVLSTWWENRQARQTETEPLRTARLKHQLAMQQAGYSRDQAAAKHNTAMQGIGAKGAQQRAKKVPSSSEFGSKSLRRSNTGSGGAGSGSGSGKSTSFRTNTGGTGRKNNGSGNGPGPKPRTNNNTGSGGKNRGGRGGGGGGGRNNGAGPKKNPSPNKPGPLRNTQRGGGALKKAGGGSNNTPANSPKTPKSPAGGGGQGRTTLRKALAHDTQKAAARRLKRRRKAGASPAVWKNNTPATPKGNGTGKGKNNTNPRRPPHPALGNGTTTKNQKTPKTPKATPGAGGKNARQTRRRTTLAQALRQTAHRAARNRLKQRRHNPATPPIWTASGAGTPKVNLTKPKNTRRTPGTGTPGARTTGQNGRTGQQNSQQKGSRWAKARAYAQKKAARAAAGAGAGQQNNGQAPPKGWATWGQYWQYLNAQHNQRTGYTQQTGRKSPFQNAGQAAGQAGVTITVERDDYVGAQAKRWEPNALGTGTPALPSTGPAALAAAPAVAFPRPGTTRPKEPIPMPPALAKPDPRITKARNQAARTGNSLVGHQMAAEHATEITLDDALDEYGDFKDDAFKTYDQTHKLADRAIKLRDILIGFAEELAVKHNLIGPLFSAAMARLAESMDLIARMSEEMQTSSLEAAEMAEAADNDLNDAYRPYSTATADAGLSTPSAPIHNET